MNTLTDLNDAPAIKDPDVCIYAVAMTLRGNADGSAEGTASVSELRACANYIQRRLEAWSPGRTASDEHLRLFLVAVLDEALPTLQRWEAM